MSDKNYFEMKEMLFDAALHYKQRASFSGDAGDFFVSVFSERYQTLVDLIIDLDLTAEFDTYLLNHKAAVEYHKSIISSFQYLPLMYKIRDEKISEYVDALMYHLIHMLEYECYDSATEYYLEAAELLSRLYSELNRFHDDLSKKEDM